MKYLFPKGSTSVIVPVFIQDSSSTTGAGLGSLTEASSVVGGYVRPGSVGVALAVDENVTTEGTYQAPSAAGKVRIGTPANMRTGTYELHFHNDLLASGADAVLITLGGASNMADLVIEIQLIDVLNNFNPASDTVKLGNVAHGGVDATLVLKSAVVDNDAGTGVELRSTGSDGKGLDITGNGTGDGLRCTGGSSSGTGLKAKGGNFGHGMHTEGGASGGIGLLIQSLLDNQALAISAAADSLGIQIITSGTGLDISGSNVLQRFADGLRSMPPKATVQASPSPTTTECDTDLTLNNPDQLEKRVILFLDGDNVYAQSVIRASTTGGLLTYDAIPVAPTSGDTLIVI